MNGLKSNYKTYLLAFGVLALGFLAFFGVMSSTASDADSYNDGVYGNWEYTVDGTEATVTAFEPLAGVTVVKIPAEIPASGDVNYTVTAIGDDCFRNNQTMSVIKFSDDCKITKIGDYAFAGCIELYSSSEISNILTVPASVVDFGNGVFQGCTSLNSVWIKCNLDTVPDFMYNGCTKLYDADFGKEGDYSPSKIGSYAFADTHLMSVDLKNVEIGSYAYKNISVLSIILTDCVVLPYAFYKAETTGLDVRGNSNLLINSFADSINLMVILGKDVTLCQNSFSNTFNLIDGTEITDVAGVVGYMFMYNEYGGNYCYLRISANLYFDEDHLSGYVLNISKPGVKEDLTNGMVVISDYCTVYTTVKTGYEIVEAKCMTLVADGEYTVGAPKDQATGKACEYEFVVKPINYTITYDVPSVKDETYTIEESHLLATPADKVGYTFKGWYSNPELTGEPVTKIEAGSTGDMKFYAKWELNSHTVTYEINDKVYLEPFTYKFGEKVTVLSKAVVKGYTVSDWDKKDFVMPDSDVVIKATATPIPYKVALAAKGDNVKGFQYSLDEGKTYKDYSSPITVDYDATVIVKALPAYGYRVDTWDNGCTAESQSFTVSGDTNMVVSVTDGKNSNYSSVDYTIFVILAGVAAFIAAIILIVRH